MNHFGADDSWVQQQLSTVAPLVTGARSLGSDLLAAATAFKGQGRELPGELLARYVQWEEQFSMLRQEWEAETRLADYHPKDKDRHTLGGWIAGLERCADDIRTFRDSISKDRTEKLEVIDGVLGLTCNSGSQEALRDVQVLAEGLRMQLMDDSSRWQDALQAPEHQSIRTLWELVLDARDGRIDEPESVKRSEAVAKQFGVRVAMQAFAGRFVPANSR